MRPSPWIHSRHSPRCGWSRPDIDPARSHDEHDPRTIRERVLTLVDVFAKGPRIGTGDARGSRHRLIEPPNLPVEWLHLGRSHQARMIPPRTARRLRDDGPRPTVPKTRPRGRSRDQPRCAVTLQRAPSRMLRRPTVARLADEVGASIADRPCLRLEARRVAVVNRAAGGPWAMILDGPGRLIEGHTRWTIVQEVTVNGPERIALTANSTAFAGSREPSRDQIRAPWRSLPRVGKPGRCSSRDRPRLDHLAPGAG